MPDHRHFDEFNPDNYFDSAKKKLAAANKTVDVDMIYKLYSKGIILLTQYYTDKYHAKITVPLDNKNQPEGWINFLNGLDQRIVELKKNQGDYREAFIVGADESHAIPVIYIKENGKDVLLLADSLGDESGIKAQMLKRFTNMDVITVLRPRQKDGFSCYADAVILSRDATGMVFDKENRKYYIPSLLKLLESRSNDNMVYRNYNKDDPQIFRSALLPAELLKTAQRPDFINEHDEKLSRIIHKNETLNEFKARYTTTYDEDSKSWNYIQFKGGKFIKLIEIQFYLNQLKNLVGNSWNDEMRRGFIILAKNHFNSANEYANNKITLKETAENYLDDLVKKFGLTVNHVESSNILASGNNVLQNDTIILNSDKNNVETSMDLNSIDKTDEYLSNELDDEPEYLSNELDDELANDKVIVNHSLSSAMHAKQTLFTNSTNHTPSLPENNHDKVSNIEDDLSSNKKILK